MTKIHKKILIFSLSVSVFFGLSIIFNPAKTFAIRNVFPNCDNEKEGCNPATEDLRLYAVVANNQVLGSQYSTFKVFIPNDTKIKPPTVEIRIKDACKRLNRDNKDGTIRASVHATGNSSDVLSYTPNRLTNGDFKYYVTDANGNPDRGRSNCTGDDIVFNNIPSSEFNTAQSDRFGLKYATAIVKVEKIGNNNGNKHFKVSVPGSLNFVTFDDLGSDFVGPNPSAGDLATTDRASSNIRNVQFDADGDESETSIKFKFKTDCKFNENQVVYFKWHDADWNEQAENFSKNIHFNVNNLDTGNSVLSESGPSMGNNHASQQKDVPRPPGLKNGVKYEWKWQQVQNQNGLQLWMPFSEISEIINCDPPPQPNPDPVADAECRLIEFSMPQYHAPPGAHDGSQGYRLYINGNLKAYDNTGDGDTSPIPNGGAGGPDAPTGNESDRYTSGPLSGQHKKDKSYNMRDFGTIVSGNFDWEVVRFHWVERDTNGGSPGGWVWFEEPRDRNSGRVTNCYRAQCEILDVFENVPGTTEGVKGGDYFRILVRMTNIGRNDLPMGLNASHLSLASPTTLQFYESPTRLGPGGYYDFDIYVTAPHGVQTWPVSFYPDYPYGYPFGPIGQSCTANVNVYEDFDINLSAEVTLQPDEEEPTNVNWKTIARNTYSNTVSMDVFSWLEKNGGTVQSNTATNTPLGTGTHIDNYPPSPLNLGDSYCSHVTVPHGSGLVGPGNDIKNSSGPRRGDSVCPRVTFMPYMRVYGADANAGGVFEVNSNTASCSSSSNRGFIKTYRRTNNAARSGSGIQLAAQALRQITGFTSASLRTSPVPPPYPATGLSFSNTNGVGGGGFSPNDGGNFGGNGACIPDYYDTTQYTDNKMTDLGGATAFNTASFTTTQAKAKPVGGPLTLTSSGVSGQHTLYVEGDVVINSNIQYNMGDNFALVVKGNIYINPNVTSLDGFYIAQPKDDGSAGEISTCAGGANGTSNLLDYNACINKLTINGAFLAKTVRFLRTPNSLQHSLANNQELPNGKSAEVFNFSPEFYLWPPAFNTPSTSVRPYDYITTLPPIL